ncbi:MAG: hypothetical protein JSS53_03165 [Proteobacteria bacterium]|nr:hypothetical protein [Pseudomonadota bacterium]
MEKIITMMATTIKQNFSYFVTGILIFAISAILTPRDDYKPKGIFLPNPSYEWLSESLESALTDDSEILGSVNAEIHSKKPMKSKKIEITEYAKSLAKKYGADELVIFNLGYEPTLGSYQLTGVAIKKSI